MTAEPSKENILVIEIHPNFFAFAVKSTGSTSFKPVVFETQNTSSSTEIQAELLGKWLKRYQTIWSHTYDNIQILLHNQAQTIVKEEETAKNALSLLFDIDFSQHKLFTHKVQEDWVWAMAVSEELSSMLNSYFLNAKILPGANGWMNWMKQSFSNEQQLGIMITPGAAHFALIEKGTAKYYNTFQFNNKEDLLYYILLVYSSLNLNPMSDPAVVIGWIEEDSPLFELLYQYIRNISIAKNSVEVDPEVLEHSTLQSHYLTNILSANL